ncbi:hypothetical protein HH219_09085 [Pseudoalteromonas sp. NEC-BIFX-2020_015]|nr:hypothetical protein [Pseudoalteromonas sp. NEC-BIFX-2020_015]
MVNDYDIDIIELEIPEEHIHMVVRSEPKMSASKVMQVVNSSYVLIRGLIILCIALLELLYQICKFSKYDPTP